jgi:hypothetical protein
MSTVVALPPTLREKLAGLTRRIRLLRAVRGASLLLLVLLLLGGGVVLADHFLALPPLALRAALATVLGGGLLAALVGLVIPLCRRLDPEALAAVIENHYPELGERLTTTVELADGTDSFHGSRQLIALLIQETDAQTSPLDFTRAFSGRTTRQLACAAVIGLVLAVIPGLLWPDRYRELIQRLFTAWAPTEEGRSGAPAVDPPGTFAIQVTPGDRYELKGRPLTVQAQLQPDSDRVNLPAACELVCTAAHHVVTRYPMSARGPKSFFFHLDRVEGDLRYQVRAGERRSATYRLTAVDAVADVTPPPYVNPKSLAPQHFAGSADVTALQYTRIVYTARYSRPAARATLRLAGSEGKAVAALPLTLADGRMEARGQLPALGPGTYQPTLVLKDDAGRPSRLRLQPLLVWSDLPPLFREVSWKDDPRLSTVVETDKEGRISETVRPQKGDPIRYVPEGQTVPLAVAVTDKVGVGEIGIEYRLASDPHVHYERIVGAGGLPDAKAKYSFSLADKVRPGGTILYRLRAADNRRVARGAYRNAAGHSVPSHDLGPNVIYFPANKGKDRWFALTIDPAARQLGQQQIAKARALRRREIDSAAHEIDRQLEEVRRRLLQEQAAVKTLRKTAEDQGPLPSEQAQAVEQVRKQNRDIQADLQALADRVEEKAGLLPLAKTARAVAEREMQQSAEALKHAAEKQPPPTGRGQEFARSDRQLARALQQIDLLRRQNQQAAKEKLDQAQLETVAERQEELARRAAELAARDPIRDPKAQAELQRLQREQDEVARELRRLTEDSEALRRSVSDARAEEALRLAQKAQDLARAQRENDPRRSDGALAELARKQKELADRAARLAQDTRQATETASTAPLRPEEAKRAAEALKQGKVREALGRQDQAARELERLANDLKRAVELAEDPREAARQLARLQEGLRKRTQEAIRKRRNLPDLHHEQEAIRQAAENLAVPRSQRDAESDRQLAAEHAARAAESLRQRNPRQAASRMDQTQRILERLAGRLPSLQERKQRAYQEMVELKRQQVEVQRQTADALQRAAAVRNPADRKAAQARDQALSKRLNEAALRQAQLAERLNKADVPRHEARRERAQQALNQALADLKENRKQDVAASLEKARRELERLEQAIAGGKPVDAQARDLAQRQQELAAQARKLAGNPKATPRQRQELQHRQQQLGEETRGLPRTEAPQRQAEAAEALRRAEQAVNNRPLGKDTPNQMESAAKALDRLARQLRGEESPAAQAERLAQRQARVAAQAQRRAGKPVRAEEQAKSQERQGQIAEEAKEIRGGDEAPAEKQRAAEALAKVDKAQRPAERAKTQREAADALRDLADRLAGRRDAPAKAADIARGQRELAKETARSDTKPNDPNAARRAADRQADLARRLSRLDQKGADEAAKRAAEEMAAAQKALEKAKTPAEAQKPLARAAEAAEKLAQQVAKANPPKAQPEKGPVETTSAKPVDEVPRELAERLARRWQHMAAVTRAAQRQVGRLPMAQRKQALRKALNRLGDQQNNLAMQTAALPARLPQHAQDRARLIMKQAQEALARGDISQAQQKQQEAARVLADLARQLPKGRPATPRARPEADQAGPKGLPNKTQADQAHRLAKAQRDLQTAAQRLIARRSNPPAQDNTPKALAREQQELARRAGHLARDLARDRGRQGSAARSAEKATDSAQEAAEQMASGALKEAQKAGRQTAQELHNLARRLAPPAAAAPRGANPPNAAEAESEEHRDAARARGLAERQDNLNRRAQRARQQQLRQEAAQLQGDLRRLAEQINSNWVARQRLQEAAEASRQAQDSMQQARNQDDQVNPAEAERLGSQAGRQLDQAAQRARDAVRQLAQTSPGARVAARAAAQARRGMPHPAASARAGRSVQQSQRHMENAQNKLGQAQTQSARGSMQKAADALKHATQQLAGNRQAPQRGKPNSRTFGKKGAGPGDGKPDLILAGKDQGKYAGKAWGELPGELRTKIIQDMKAKYGEDYARIIKLYFEQMADTKKK